MSLLGHDRLCIQCNFLDLGGLTSFNFTDWDTSSDFPMYSPGEFQGHGLGTSPLQDIRVDFDMEGLEGEVLDLQADAHPGAQAVAEDQGTSNPFY